MRDRIVCGILDHQLRERLLRIPDLTLDKCFDMCRAAEITKQGISVLFGNSNNQSETVNKVSKGKSNGSDKPLQMQNKPCKFCTKFHEPSKEKCLAYGKKCRLCHKMNHCEQVCRNASKKSSHQITKKTVHSIQTSECSDSDDYSVWTLHIEANIRTANSVSKGVHVKMNVQGHEVNFQLDIGTTCNILPNSAIPNMPPLMPTTYTLQMYNKSTIRPLGKTQLQVTNPKNGTAYNIEFVVIEEDCTPLLGNRSLQAMELMNWEKENILCVKHNLPAPLSKKQLFMDYPDVFEGVGRLKELYHLVLDENAQPVAHAPRKVPVALKPLLKAKLTRLQEMNIFASVSEPTSWVSSCLMVVKPNKVRICIYSKDLNKALNRSHYILSTIEEILPNLS